MFFKYTCNPLPLHTVVEHSLTDNGGEVGMGRLRGKNAGLTDLAPLLEDALHHSRRRKVWL